MSSGILVGYDPKLVVITHSAPMENVFNGFAKDTIHIISIGCRLTSQTPDSWQALCVVLKKM
jgi:hypothetical protein